MTGDPLILKSCGLESRRDKMKRHTTVMALGAFLTLVLTVPSFAEAGGHVKHHPRASAADAYSGYYNSSAGSNADGNYNGFGSYAVGGFH